MLRAEPPGSTLRPDCGPLESAFFSSTVRRLRESKTTFTEQPLIPPIAPWVPADTSKNS